MTDLHDLLPRAGAPPRPPEHEVAAIKEAARVAWRARYGRRRPWLLPLAATVVIGLAIGWWSLRPPTGESVVETQASGLGLRLSGGQSLRLDPETRLVVESPRLVRLERGTLVFDSDGGEPVTIRTPSGDFVPVGTRFEVRVTPGAATELRVREGRVLFIRPSGVMTIAAGETLAVQPDGLIDRSLDIEGRSLHTFLEWIARQNGWELKFLGEAESSSKTIILHGSIETLTAAEALQTVMLSSGLDYELSDGTLTVSVSFRAKRGIS